MESLTRLAGLAEPLHAAMGRPDRSGPSPAVAITDQASAPTALRPDLLCWGKLASGWLAETEAKNCHLHKNLDTSQAATDSCRRIQSQPALPVSDRRLHSAGNEK